jgi:DNA-binding LacI/PurR family transcriptional regulator
MMLNRRKAATIREVAERARVSIATVSYVLSGKKKLSPSTEIRVFNAVEELGYLPNQLARNLKSNTTTTIGILVADIRNPFFPSIVEFVSKYLADEEYGIFVASSYESVHEQEKILKLFLQHKIGGLIAIPTGPYEEIFTQFQWLSHKIPLILLDRDIPRLPCAKVLLDHAEGTWKLTTHLIQAGHRKIGIVTPPLYLSIGMERLEGYKRALKESDIQVDEEIQFEGNLFQDSGEQAAEHFLGIDEARRPTAVVSCNEMMTMGFLRRIHRHGMDIPRDFSLVSFDDPDHFEFFDPPITSYRQPERHFGEKAVDLLTKELKSIPLQNRRIILRGELMDRKSVLTMRTSFQERIEGSK